MKLTDDAVKELMHAAGNVIEKMKEVHTELERALPTIREFEPMRRAYEEAHDSCDCASNGCLDLAEYCVALRHTINVYGYDMARVMEKILAHIGCTEEDGHPMGNDQRNVVLGILREQDLNLTVREVLTRAGVVPEREKTQEDKSLN